MVIQPEVVSFIGIVDWQIPLGPPHISHWHPVLDRRLFIDVSDPTLPSSSLQSQVRRSSCITIHLAGDSSYPRTSRKFLSESTHMHKSGISYPRYASVSVQLSTKLHSLRNHAQRWRIGEGFTEISATSTRSATDDDDVPQNSLCAFPKLGFSFLPPRLRDGWCVFFLL